MTVTRGIHSTASLIAEQPCEEVPRGVVQRELTETKSASSKDRRIHVRDFPDFPPDEDIDHYIRTGRSRLRLSDRRIRRADVFPGFDPINEPQSRVRSEEPSPFRDHRRRKSKPRQIRRSLVRPTAVGDGSHARPSETSRCRTDRRVATIRTASRSRKNTPTLGQNSPLDHDPRQHPPLIAHPRRRRRLDPRSTPP
jgi:hypothetical protein